MTRLLVSVRSADEALQAVAAGVDLVDVKEPSRGSLGRADWSQTLAILRAVAGRRPVSAALGELVDDHSTLPVEAPSERAQPAAKASNLPDSAALLAQGAVRVAIGERALKR